jgi:hypothetical protein
LRHGRILARPRYRYETPAEARASSSAIHAVSLGARHRGTGAQDALLVDTGAGDLVLDRPRQLRRGNTTRAADLVLRKLI